MITCFPKPYPDEIFYSICARYSDRMRYSTKQAVAKDVFGCSAIHSTIVFPCHLAYLVNNLPKSYSYSIDRFIDEHTFFPFFRPFLPQNRLYTLREAMSGNKGSSVYLRFGITVSRIPLPRAEHLRFCPVCIKEDRKRWGECYWHRIHQLPGVEICPMHKAYLCKSNIDGLDPGIQTKFLSAEAIVDASTPDLVVTSDFCNTILLNIALDINWIMHQHDLSFNHAFFKQRYLMLLTERGLAKRHAREPFDVPSILQEFKAYYPLHLIRKLSCELAEHEQKNWLWRLLYNKDRLIHPLYHLLVIHFLGCSIKTFVNLPSPQSPFGDSPWFCLNPTSEHYREKVVYNCAISVSNSKDKKPKGVFSCECGFVYSRIGPDTCENDSYKIKNILAVGSVWEETFRELWSDPTISQVEMVRCLGINKAGLQCHAARLGLPFPRPGSILREPSRKIKSHLQGGLITVETRQYYRTLWLELRQENPEMGTENLRQHYPKIYSWLFDHDKTWLQVNKPPRPKQNYLPKPRIDWNKRDKKNAEKVAVIASQIRSSEDTLEQVTRAAILRHMSNGRTLKADLTQGKLPLTRQVIDSLVESFEEFVIRRIWWMRDVYLREEHVIPKRWLFARQTGADDYQSSPEVKEAFEAAMQSLEAFFTFDV